MHVSSELRKLQDLRYRDCTGNDASKGEGTEESGRNRDEDRGGVDVSGRSSNPGRKICVYPTNRSALDGKGGDMTALGPGSANGSSNSFI